MKGNLVVSILIFISFAALYLAALFGSLGLVPMAFNFFRNAWGF